MAVFAAGVLAAAVLSAGGSVDARRAIKPKAGGYVGKVTNANGKGSVQLIVRDLRDPAGLEAAEGDPSSSDGPGCSSARTA